MGGMRMNNSHGLSAENLLRMLPAALQNDDSMKALASSIAQILSERLTEIQQVMIYPQINNLPNNLLDILAYDLKVDWWDGNYTLEEKRRTLKDSWRVHRMLGTKAAVELTVSAIYPGTQVQEWFEYDGRPYHFRLILGGVGASVEEINQFSQSIERVKNVRSVLESIVFREQSTSTIYTGIAARQGDRYRLAPVVCSGYRQNPVYCGIAPRQGDQYQLRPLSCGPLRRDPVRVGMVMRQADKIIVKQVKS